MSTILEQPAPSLRSHGEIVREYGAQRLRTLLTEKGFDVSTTTPQRWADRNSIPGDYWNVISNEGIATLEELAFAAEARKSAA
ncbi:hypothetical protein D3Y57_06965 [Sphingomonas paeninsulae]|uniref:Uncharacterized protein n=1 Tax=Sphingomonas paeninsulae TaxID=2319844 RepID=A0A494TK04_SPHPE|nr:hypothetical protein [Sphingomonas paeninsulae]AYJ85758.1 hypothetical protein D3Y57_06965 [Sphingomonas paeninsulae]